MVTPMSVAVKKLIAKLEAQLFAESSPAKRKSVYAELEAAKKTYKKVTEEATEEDDEEEEGETDDEGDDDDEPEDKKEEAADNETKRKEKDEPPPKDDDDSEEDDEDDEEEEEEEASGGTAEEEASVALTRIVAAVPGKKGEKLTGLLRALIDKAAMSDANDKRIAKIEQSRREERKEALIVGALHAKGGPRIMPAQAKWLRGQKLATVKSFLAQHTKAIVLSEDRVPDTDGRTGKADAGFNDFEQKTIAAAVAAGGKRETIEAAIKLSRVSKGDK